MDIFCRNNGQYFKKHCVDSSEEEAHEQQLTQTQQTHSQLTKEHLLEILKHMSSGQQHR